MVGGSEYTPEKKHHGYEAKMRRQAVRLYVDGMNFRRIARHLGIQHSTVSVWVKECVRHLPDAPQPKKVKTSEMDELFTFIGSKKNRIYLMTLVDRQTPCVLGWKVAGERTSEVIQQMVDETPKAREYFSDGWEAYATLWYHLGQ